MRVISNRSTGDMGRFLAREFAGKGKRVTLLEGSAATTNIPLDKAITVKKFFFYDELECLLLQELKRGYDVVIHAAAVSDFKLAKPFKGKLPSGKRLKLDLVPTKKLVAEIKKAAPRVFLVGYKLETGLDCKYILKKVKALFSDAGCDLVVANRQSSGDYEAVIIDPSGAVSPRVSTKQALVKVLAAKIDKRSMSGL